MTSLRDLQSRFLHAVLQDADAALPVNQNGIAVAQRLAIYAGNAQSNFANALESSYPVIRRLVGAEYFAQCAHSFQREHPSRSGDLQPAGARFAEFLDELHRDGDYRYLTDIARFEWLLQEAWLAADHAPLELGKLAAVAAHDYDRLVFKLHPSLRLFDSRYPCHAIWQANNAVGEPPCIDLYAAPGERIALMQTAGAMSFHALNSGEHAFLMALKAAAPFAVALQAGGEEFDAGAALRRFVLAAAIVDFQ